MNWDTLRPEFPVTRQWAYLDHAAVAPLSARARQAMLNWADDVTAHGHVFERQRLQQLEKIRGLAARLLDADPLDIAFIKNTSESIGIVAEGFPWQAGDNVVIAEEV